MNWRRAVAGTSGNDIRYARECCAKTPAFTLMRCSPLRSALARIRRSSRSSNAVLLRPLPFGSRGFGVASQKTPQRPQVGFSIPDLFDFKEQSRSFITMSGFTPNSSIRHRAGDAAVAGQLCQRRLLRRSGRAGPTSVAASPRATMTPEQGRSRSSRQVWRERFGGDPEVIGRKVTLDGGRSEILA